MYRRQFLQSCAVSVAATTSPLSALADDSEGAASFKISLAEWSLHRTLRDPSQKMTNLDFARVAKQEFGIDAIEYVNQFFKDKANDESYLEDLKQRSESEGVRNLLIMIDGEGQLGAPDQAERTKSVENHYKWVDAAKFLGCHSIRVNAGSRGSYEEQQKLAADGLRSLCEYAQPLGLNVIVENHGGLSSNGKWLVGVIENVGMDNCGTLPDFGNFYISRGPNPELYDRYQGVDELMPYAHAVSAKTNDFDESGNETTTDFERMMRIVVEKHDYHGYVGIEYEGRELSEMDGIRKSKALLQRVAKSLGKK